VIEDKETHTIIVLIHGYCGNFTDEAQQKLRRRLLMEVSNHELDVQRLLERKNKHDKNLSTNNI
jgi:hypothetical protein